MGARRHAERILPESGQRQAPFPDTAMTTPSLTATLRHAASSGGAASLLSIAALARRGRVEVGSPYAPLNAPSHWLFGERALRKNEPSLRYTATGVLTHHLSALFWAVLYERMLAHRDAGAAAPSVRRQLRDAALVTATAAVVDLAVVPKRLTPGFERRLSRRSLALVYAAFGLGLAAGSLAMKKRRRG
jgi:hypothetical protein